MSCDGCWLAVYYFYQYVLRSSPAVMMPQLSAGVRPHCRRRRLARRRSSITAIRRSAWSPARRWTGSAPKVMPLGALVMAGVGALLFGTGNLTAA